MIIVRYLIRETVKTQLAVMFVLFLVFFSQKFIRVLATATDGEIPATEIITFVGLYMPSMAMLMLPLSLYIGILITFGRMYAESEITVMNATGIGNRFLVRAALSLALITGSLAAFNALWLTPWANDKEIKMLETVKADSGLELLIKGQIQSTPNGEAVVFIQDIDKSKQELQKIFIAQPTPRGSLRPSVIVADRGIVHELADGRQLLQLKDGVRYEGVPTRLDYAITDYKDYQVLIGQRKVADYQQDWDAMPTLALLGNSNILAQTELQWRISLVLCIPLMTLIAVPLSSVNPRQGRFAKLFPAILIYLAYFLTLSAMKSAMEEGSVPVVIGLWPVNIVALIVGVMLVSWDSLAMRKLRLRWRGVNV